MGQCSEYVLRPRRFLMPAPVPPWLLSDGAQPGARLLVDRVDQIHPDDRDLVGQVFLDALDAPGVPQEAAYRKQVDGRWCRERYCVLDLAGRPDLGGVLIFDEVIAEIDLGVEDVEIGSPDLRSAPGPRAARY